MKVSFGAEPEPLRVSSATTEGAVEVEVEDEVEYEEDEEEEEEEGDEGGDEEEEGEEDGEILTWQTFFMFAQTLQTWVVL